MKKQNKVLIILIAILVLLLIGVKVVKIPHSKEISTSIQGLKFQLYPENEVESLPVSVEIKGSVYYSAFGEIRFKGAISIIDSSLEDPNKNRKLNMKIHKTDQGYMSALMDFEDLSTKPYWNDLYNSIFFSKDFKSVTIRVAEQNSITFIAGPAKNEVDAKKITKQLMEDYLKKNNDDGLLMYLQ
ncbi:hypothetical protein M3194_15825 [Paenibacillus glycanilyticus]|uniref:hypothetical protein n=1 Tax=Paenibacillus glycanilyticus TaxID=126569 RepID=UPI0020424C8C|nr:hypothetical protein [Paenibacillus glycanilyticus]MCM3628813.1 hypothetical protein [Paenibacillus glycanilyticus]